MPRHCSVLLTPSLWHVAPGLSYARTGPSIYFHVLQWKLLCCKTIPVENKTSVNKKWNLPRGQFHRFTCKPVIVVNCLNANPAETLTVTIQQHPAVACAATSAGGGHQCCIKEPCPTRGAPGLGSGLQLLNSQGRLPQVFRECLGFIPGSSIQDPDSLRPPGREGNAHRQP